MGCCPLCIKNIYCCLLSKGVTIDKVVRTMLMDEATNLINRLQGYAFGIGMDDAIGRRRSSNKPSEFNNESVKGNIHAQIGDAINFYPDDGARLDALETHLTENAVSYILSASNAWQGIENARGNWLDGKRVAGAVIGGLIGVGVGFAAQFNQEVPVSIQASSYAAPVLSAMGYVIATVSIFGRREERKLESEWNAHKRQFLDDALRAFTSD